MQALLVGLFLALAVGAFATTLRLDRDRAFYPTIMIVIAAYYVLFALMAASNDALPVELLVAAAFVTAAAGLTEFFAWTVSVRLSVFLFFSAFVLLKLAPPVLLVFAIVDAVAAIWTRQCL